MFTVNFFCEDDGSVPVADFICNLKTKMRENLFPIYIVWKCWEVRRDFR